MTLYCEGEIFHFPICLLTAWKHGFLFYAMSYLLLLLSLVILMITFSKIWPIETSCWLQCPLDTIFLSTCYFLPQDVPDTSCTFPVLAQESAISPRNTHMYIYILYIYNTYIHIYLCKSYYTSSSTSASHNC